MQMIKRLLITALLSGISMSIVTAKITKPEFIEGTTLGKYKKPGAPVNIAFSVQRVQSGEPCHIKIRFITVEKSGTMQVKVKADKALRFTEQFNTQTRITLDGSREYPMEFSVIASSDGVYRIRLLVEMGNKGFRAFVIPVKIGNGTLYLKQKSLMKNKHGENITVSPAKEQILRK